MLSTEELFKERNEWASFHDVLTEVFLELGWMKKGEGLDFSIESMIEIFNSLDPHTRAIAHEWGLSDTVFRDEAYTEILNRV